MAAYLALGPGPRKAVLLTGVGMTRIAGWQPRNGMIISALLALVVPAVTAPLRSAAAGRDGTAGGAEL
jgi:hypothetical protein